MKFTKLTLVALILALMVCAFAACGGDTPVETEGDTPVVTEGDAPVVTEPTNDSGETEPEAPAGCQHTNTVEEIEEATCEQRGYRRVKCADCSEMLSVSPIDLVDHVAVAEATCTEGSVCKFCGAAMASATGHKVETYTDVKEATKTEEGYKKGKCSACGVEITEILPAGITDNYNGLEAGPLTVEALQAATAYEGFTLSVTADTFEVVTEGDNSYVKKLNPNGQIKYAGSELNAEILEFTFDFRLDQDPGSLKALLSIVNGGKEMRILNVKGDGFYFGVNTNGVVKFAPVEIGKWVNLKLVLDTRTYDYEVYVDGELMVTTGADPDVAGNHLIYVKEGDQMVEKTKTTAGFNIDVLHNGADRSPFVPNGNAVEQFYFFHYTKDLCCSLDNVTAGFKNAQ